MQLGLRLLADLRPRFTDGVWLVQFATVSEHVRYRALSQPRACQRTLRPTIVETIVSAVADRNVLLLLDNWTARACVEVSC